MSIENNNKNIEQEKQNKNWWKKLLGLNPTYGLLLSFLFFIFILIISYFILNYSSYKKPQKYDFITIGKTNSIYPMGGCIAGIPNNKYFFIGLERNKNSSNFLHFELFDYNKKSITKIRNDILSSISDSVVMSDNNIFFIGFKSDNLPVFGIIHTDTFKIEVLGYVTKILNTKYFSFPCHLYSLSGNRVLIYDITGKERNTLIWDNNDKKFIEGPLNVPREKSSAIEITDNSILILGGIKPYSKEIEANYNIEICDLAINKCKNLNVNLNHEQIIPKLFKDKKGNILIFPSEINKNLPIEKYNIKSGKVEIIGYIDKYYDENNNIEKIISSYNKITGIMGANFVQLRDGNILITGGYSGISMPEASPYVLKYDINSNKLFRLKDMSNIKSNKRINHKTILLEDGNVLFIGGFSKNIDLFIVE